MLELGSDKTLTGAIEYSSLLPWERSAQQMISPEQIALEGGEPREVTIVLEPLGQSHPQGRGSEIWLYQIGSEVERIGPEQFKSLVLPRSWKHDEERAALVFTGGERTALTLKLRAIAKVSLHLLKHPWSGQVRVSADGVSRTIDLYDPLGSRTIETLLLPTPLDVTLRVETVLPRTARSFRLVFTDGPRSVRLGRIEWRSRGLWVWDPKHDPHGVEVGPGVQIIEKGKEGWLLEMERSGGWVEFHGLQVKPFFVPGLWGLIVITLLGLAWWTWWEIYRPRTRVGTFLRSQAYWAKYTLPCFAVWFAYWLAFFPGLMSPDSLDSWRQIVGLQHLNDDHPAFHTFLLWLVTRIWFSPAAFTLIQVGAMSGLIGWELAYFAHLGVPHIILWGICSLFALSPVMGTMTITLWKDIPYGMSVLWLTLLLVKIVVSRGEWLRSSRWHIMLLGAALTFVALFRHNGIFVSLGTVAILGVVYRRYWREILITCCLVVGIYGLTKGPVYQALGVQRISNFLLYHVPVHQVAAVIAAGTPLTDQEKLVLDKLFPIDKWGPAYYCAAPHSIIFSKEFNPDLLEFDDEYRSAFRRIWFSLIFRNLMAVVRHQLCAGSLVWVVPQLTYLYTVPKEIPQNELGLSTQSQWPAARRWILTILDWSERPDVIWVLWRPALYLYALLGVTVLIAYRKREPRWLLLAVPALLQSVSLLLVNAGQDFRYQYSVYLVGVMSLGLLPLAVKRNKPIGAAPHGEQGVCCL